MVGVRLMSKSNPQGSDFRFVVCTNSQEWPCHNLDVAHCTFDAVFGPV